MDTIDVIGVTGACGPERRAYAKRLAEQTGRDLYEATRIAAAPDAALEAAELVGWSLNPAGAIVELPIETPVSEVIGALAEPGGRTRLSGIVCVVDAVHLLGDLARDDYLARPVAGTGGVDHIAMAMLIVHGIEFASTVLLVGWQSLSGDELSCVMALIAHLSPSARLRLDGAPGDHSSSAALQPVRYEPAQDRPGWLRLLSGEFDPVMTDGRVSAFRYEQMRPVHPGRLLEVLDGRVEPGEFGTLVRSAGFCRFATRPGVTAQWEQIGSMLSIEPVASDRALRRDLEAGYEPLSFGQDIAFIGLDLDACGLRAALDEAALDDAEFAAGPRAWRGMGDPFPAWTGVAGRAW